MDYWNTSILADLQIILIIKCLLVQNGWNAQPSYGLLEKNVPYRQKHTHIHYMLIFNFIHIWGKWTRNLRLYRRFLEHCYLHTQIMDVEEDSDQNLDLYSPARYVGMGA